MATTKVLAVKDERASINFGPFVLTRTGLRAIRKPTTEEYLVLGKQLVEIERMYQWCIGDYLLMFEHDKGQMYTQALDASIEKTWKNYVYVAKHVVESRRRDSLSWTHHAEVAHLHPQIQDGLLEKAVSHGWSTRDLRKMVRELKHKANGLVSGRYEPVVQVESAEDLSFLDNESIDIIITSPPYNLGQASWPMGGQGRTVRESGIGYDDNQKEAAYQAWQVDVLNELYRVAKPRASLFYNHKVRQQDGAIIHPMEWLAKSDWTIRQEIIWDRGSTHNHNPYLFWPEDERIYWLVKGKPIIADGGVGQSTVWRFHGPIAGTWHPAPFSEELPRRCLQAVGFEGALVLDPFGGSMTTCIVASEMGMRSIGVDVNPEYIEKVKKEYGWRNVSNNKAGGRMGK